MVMTRKSIESNVLIGAAVVSISALIFFAFILKNRRLSPKEITRSIHTAYDKFKPIQEGKNADYISYLKSVNPDLYAISIVTTDGKLYQIGDTNYEFGIESISKIFTLALALQENGTRLVRDSIDVNAVGLPVDSVTAIELEDQEPSNPFVNTGAVAITSMIRPKNNQQEKWQNIHNYFNKFANRNLNVIQPLYESEAAIIHKKGIAMLLQSYDQMCDDPNITLDVYAKQCALGVTSKDLAVMSATLANGGINPITKERLVDAENVPAVLSVMTTAGLYENTGEWMFSVGLPAKSGAGGGIIAVVPGVMGIAVFSPPLDEAGNSVKGQKTIAYLSDVLKLNIFTAKR